MRYTSFAVIRFCFAILISLPLFAFAQKDLVITGKVTGLIDGAKVALVDPNNPTDTLGAGVVKTGVFTIKHQMKEPLPIFLAFSNTQRLVLFLDNNKVSVTGNINDLKNIKVTGSPTHTAFEDFKSKFDPLFEGLNRLSMATGRQDSLQMVANNIRFLIQKEIDVYIKKYDKSPVSTFLLAVTNSLQEDILLTERRLNSIAAAATDNSYGQYLKQLIADGKLNAVGSLASDFTQADTSGTPVSLSSFRGKYVLLDFWASWCGPCRQENPNVVYTYNKFKDKNFTVLGVSLDRPGQKEKWMQAIHTDNLTWTHVSDLQFWNNAVAKQYKIESIPQNFLIGPDGKVIAKNLRGPALESKLCEVLGCN